MLSSPVILAVQADPVLSLNPSTDTSLLLALEAQKRGMMVFFYTPQHLYLDQGIPIAKGVFVTLEKNADGQSLKIKSLSDTVVLSLSDAAYIVIRQNPPYNMAYLLALDMLCFLDQNKTKVINAPDSLARFKEKLIPQLFPEICPLTRICQTIDHVYDFQHDLKIHSKRAMVLKPLHSFGGNDVFLIKADDVNTDALVHMMCDRYPDGLVAQEFLKDVSHNERRLIFIDGILKSVFKRIPKEQSIRSNTVVGGIPTVCDLSKDDEQIACRIGPFLKEKGFNLAGVDAIGPYLIEVNVTSPTGLWFANRLYEKQLEVDFWNAILK